MTAAAAIDDFDAMAEEELKAFIASMDKQTRTLSLDNDDPSLSDSQMLARRE